MYIFVGVITEAEGFMFNLVENCKTFLRNEAKICS